MRSIVGLLADDPTLEPRDVLVMCPDVETFAPIIAATFAIGAEDDAAHPAARLRVRLADRALRQTNALLAVLSQLLELGTARLTATPGARPGGYVRRCGRGSGSTTTSSSGCATGPSAPGVRWGLDREHRATWQLGDLEQGTLARRARPAAARRRDGGRARALATTSCRSTTSTARTSTWPVGSPSWSTGSPPRRTLMPAGTPRPSGWPGSRTPSAGAGRDDVTRRRGSCCSCAASSATSPRPPRAAPRCSGSPTCARCSTAASPGGRPGRASAPARSPSARSCRCGRCRTASCACSASTTASSRGRATSDGDDVLARDPWVGERDPRSEDRQLLLDAICAAEDHLVITYTGADERTGAPVPPAVPLGELLDALDRTASAADGQRVRDVITTHHPLQPFDPRNFEPGDLRRAARSASTRSGTPVRVAAAGPRTEPLPVFSAPLPAEPAARRRPRRPAPAAEHPARGFLRQRLQVAETRRRGRAGRRAAGRAGQPRAVGRRRAGAARAAGRARPRRVPRPRGAPRRPAARPARRSAACATSAARSRASSLASTLDREAPARVARRRRTPVRRHPPRRHRERRARRRPAHADLLAAGRAAPAARLDRPGRADRRGSPTARGARSPSVAAAARVRCAARSTRSTQRRRGWRSTSSSRSIAPGCARRCPCRSRRPRRTPSGATTPTPPPPGRAPSASG